MPVIRFFISHKRFTDFCISLWFNRFVFAEGGRTEDGHFSEFEESLGVEGVLDLLRYLEFLFRIWGYK